MNVKCLLLLETTLCKQKSNKYEVLIPSEFLSWSLLLCSTISRKSLTFGIPTNRQML
ncbi:MAG: hypothetical protein IPH84_07270 [Bacteroidales bacterium]|nr:hypothetical protein [Bacteroidales bacterium]